MGILPHSVADRANVSLQRLHMNFEPLTFRLGLPDIITKITRVFAHLKPITQAKQFSDFETFRIHDQNIFEGSEYYPRPWLCPSSKTQYALTLMNFSNAQVSSVYQG